MNHLKKDMSHLFKKHATPTIIILLVIISSAVYITSRIGAVGGPNYGPGETLDPTTGPSTSFVEIFPDQTGEGGKFLTTDGSTSTGTLSWGTIPSTAACGFGGELQFTDGLGGFTCSADFAVSGTELRAGPNAVSLSATFQSLRVVSQSTGAGDFGIMVDDSSGAHMFGVRDDGRVGIGTITPSNKLSVSGDADFIGLVGIGTSTPTSDLTVIGGASTFAADIATTTKGLRVRALPGPPSDTDPLFAADTSAGDGNLFKIQYDGKVGIGTTSPAFPLDVSRTVFSSDPIARFGTSFDTFFNISSGSGSSAGLYLTEGATFKWFAGKNGANQFTISDSTLDRLTIDTSGNVGIGTTSPNASAILHLSSTSQGFLPPVMTGPQMEAISSPAAGLIIFNTTLGTWCGYTGADWRTLENNATTCVSI
jgi:hypothetical protein